jgi:hypothetical protein
VRLQTQIKKQFYVHLQFNFVRVTRLRRNINDSSYKCSKSGEFCSLQLPILSSAVSVSGRGLKKRTKRRRVDTRLQDREQTALNTAIVRVMTTSSRSRLPTVLRGLFPRHSFWRRRQQVAVETVVITYRQIIKKRTRIRKFIENGTKLETKKKIQATGLLSCWKLQENIAHIHTGSIGYLISISASP